MSNLLSSKVATVQGTSGGGGGWNEILGTELLTGDNPDELRFLALIALACDACVGDEYVGGGELRTGFGTGKGVVRVASSC